MERDAIVSAGIGERLERRQVHEIVNRSVVGACFAVANGCARCAHERIGDFVARVWIDDALCRVWVSDPCRQAVALRDIKEGECFQERNGALRSIVIGFDELGNENDGFALFALADRAASFASLIEREPTRIAETAFLGRATKGAPRLRRCRRVT